MFTYISTKLENKNFKLPFIIAPKKSKYSGINLAKEV